MSQTNTRYIHLRRRDAEGKPVATGGITVAYRTTADGIEVGFTVVSRKDTYTRAIGRDLSLANLNKDKSPYNLTIDNAIAVDKAAGALAKGATTSAGRVLTKYALDGFPAAVAAALTTEIVTKGTVDRVLSAAVIEHCVVEAVLGKCAEFDRLDLLPKNS